MRSVKRFEVPDGRIFCLRQFDNDTCCIAVADNDATRIIATYIGRLDVKFHVHETTAQLNYMNADTIVYM